MKILFNNEQSLLYFKAVFLLSTKLTAIRRRGKLYSSLFLITMNKVQMEEGFYLAHSQKVWSIEPGMA